MKFKMLFLFFLSGCLDRPPINHVVDKKFCHFVCVQAYFKSFHAKGESWGTSASSMSGMHQGKIFDVVKKDCVDFYSDMKCCKREYYHGEYTARSVHSYKYGPCMKQQKEKL